MTPRPSARFLAVSALSAGGLFAVGACSGLASDVARHAPDFSSASPDVSPTAPRAPQALTRAQAEAALITEADLGDPWAPTQGVATWRDGFLKASAPAGSPDCQRLIDALYSDELLAAPARAVVGLDDGYADAQLRYQVSAQRSTDVDRILVWLRTLPTQCRQFTATTARGVVQGVQVADSRLPAIGDARQGLRITVTRADAGESVTLTLDVAAVRVGQDAFTVANGGLGEVSTEVTRAAAELGAKRLAEVRKQGRVQV
ncbi:hypothetical protein [Streptomyces chromofuscus]|uniref:Lipoprotein n=1 Tax=Streptomyces chromofuscus TaxID=42881 RepID=A0A7M2T291_STRCW|nr:hypothetical protein [Streptomyces chromofuscus]QOV41993.1 hypothetical protein IPT68_19130 [Streptomyces chromofuscus]GGS86571.1 hypothetical protein GCM10010254_02930 [Streptomyces chromofuscus]